MLPSMRKERMIKYKTIIKTFLEDNLRCLMGQYKDATKRREKTGMYIFLDLASIPLLKMEKAAMRTAMNLAAVKKCSNLVIFILY